VSDHRFALWERVLAHKIIKKIFCGLLEELISPSAVSHLAESAMGQFEL